LKRDFSPELGVPGEIDLAATTGADAPNHLEVIDLLTWLEERLGHDPQQSQWYQWRASQPPGARKWRTDEPCQLSFQ